jgi:arabinose-5-phosphate isomerase
MIKELLAEEKRIIDHFFTTVDPEAIERVVEMIATCKGKVLFTGVGKSGIVAKKIAVTLTSTGSSAYYLSPTNALHGDIGLVEAGDLFFIFSKSGESEELVNLLPYVRNKGAYTFAIVSSKKNRLVSGCDDFLLLPVEKEICPFNLSPTISATVQMIFGDILAVALMQRKKFSLEEYALNHPAGKIGKRSSLKVKELMIRGNQLPQCSLEATLGAILSELSDKKCGCVLVVDQEKKLQGIFTDGDLRRALQQRGEKALQACIEEVMTKNPRTIFSERLAFEALQLMESDQKHPITALPVVDSNSCISGLIKLHDLIQSGV